ncbi:DUF1810 domain-containing protein [Elioraea rosea]|uniref:DUF1810 domain-containing protein n=1 Tax=Elioraea rosea TaxID=2492390 RepID=UPI001182338C|nr:DUF1810 domain-containing protein [Elioraea rosea]
MTADPHDLARFVTAQAPVIETALAELRAGRKRTHWIWFVFPQLRGLGQSPMAVRYGIASLAEARAYLAHPVLGPRLRACTEAVLSQPNTSLHAIFGSPDDMKFRSSMTLFAAAALEDDGVFERALDAFCAGARCETTGALLQRAAP